jgi:protein CpxP
MLNSNRVLKLLVAAMALALALPGVAQAQPEGGGRGSGHGPGHPGRRGPDPGHFIDRHADELGLDAEARESIQSIADESRARSEQLRGEVRDEYQAMRSMLSQSTPDEAAVMSQHERIEALKSEQRKIRLEAMLAIRKLLTPEQRDQLVEMREQGPPGRGFKGEGGPADKRRRGPLAGCRDDLTELCPEAAPGRGRLQCLDAEWDNLSDGCRAGFEGRGRRTPGGDRPVDSPAE